MLFQNCHSREFCVREYFSKNKSFVFYGRLILKYAKCKTNERTNNLLKRNYYISSHLYIHVCINTHIRYTQVWSFQVKLHYLWRIKPLLKLDLYFSESRNFNLVWFFKKFCFITSISDVVKIFLFVFLFWQKHLITSYSKQVLMPLTYQNDTSLTFF